MKNTLFINACPRPQSRTLTLAQEVLKKVSGIRDGNGNQSVSRTPSPS